MTESEGKDEANDYAEPRRAGQWPDAGTARARERLGRRRAL